MGYPDLEGHPERERLMVIAFTLSQGKADGEHAMQCNPVFVQMQKKRSEEQQKASKKGGKASF
jgi:hypothetical protein